MVIRIILLLGLAFIFPKIISAQISEKEMATEIEEVKIHLRGAEVIRNAKINLPAGKHLLVFTDLSPKINSSSIQVSQDSDDFHILSTTSRINFLKEQNKPNSEIKILQDSLVIVQDVMQDIADRENAFLQEKKLLESNQMLSGKNQAVDLEQIKAAAAYYRERFTAINRSISKIRKERKTASSHQAKIKAQLRELNAGNRPSSEVYLTINCKRSVNTNLRLRYVVNDAGWSPIYDLVVNDLDQPINLKYRALAFNDTGINWENVKIVLSTADPMQSASMPILLPWRLQQFSPQALSFNQGRLNMQSNRAQMDAKEKNNAAPQGMNIRFEEIEISELNTDFNIADPYTIPSDRKPYSIEVQQNELKADYTHYSVPKMDKDAFLLAQVVGWEDLNLIPGPVNIYYDKSFVGMSDLNPRNFNDTLNLSVGRDPRVLVKREKLKELTKRQFLAGKKKMTVGYKITVKNNRSQPIEFDLLDQVPISTRKEIEVAIKEISGATHFENTGKLEWKFKLKSGESKSVNLTFTISYPKNMEVRLHKTKKMVTPRYF